MRFALGVAELVAGEILLLLLESEEADAGRVGVDARAFLYPLAVIAAHELPQGSLALRYTMSRIIKARHAAIGTSRTVELGGAAREAEAQDEGCGRWRPPESRAY